MKQGIDPLVFLTPHFLYFPLMQSILRKMHSRIAPLFDTQKFLYLGERRGIGKSMPPPLFKEKEEFYERRQEKKNCRLQAFSQAAQF